MTENSKVGLRDRLRGAVASARAADGSPMSLRAIDRLAGRPEGHLCMILSGRRRNPAGETLRDYATALGVTVDDLLGASEEAAAGGTPPKAGSAARSAPAKGGRKSSKAARAH